MKFSDFKNNGNQSKPVVNPNQGHSSNRDQYEPLMKDSDHLRDNLAKIIIISVVAALLIGVVLVRVLIVKNVKDELAQMDDDKKEKRRLEKFNEKVEMDKKSTRPNRNRINQTQNSQTASIQKIDLGSLQRDVQKSLADLKVRRDPRRPAVEQLGKQWDSCVDPDEQDRSVYLAATKSIPDFVEPIFDEKGKPWAVGMNEKEINVYDLAGKRKHTITGARPTLHSGARGGKTKFAGYCPSRRLIAMHTTTSDRRNWITLHKVKDFALVHVLPGGRSIHFLDNEYALVEWVKSLPADQSNSGANKPQKGFAMSTMKKTPVLEEGELQVVSLDDWSVIQKTSTNQDVRWTITPGKKFVLTHSPNKQDGSELRVLDSRSLKQISFTSVKGMPTGRLIRCTPDGKKLVVADERYIGVWDLDKGEVLSLHNMMRSTSARDFSIELLPDRPWVLTAGINVLNYETGHLMGMLKRKADGATFSLVRQNNQLHTFDTALLQKAASETGQPDNPDKKPRVILKVEVRKSQAGDKATKLDKEWAEFAFKDILAKKLGWTVSESGNLPVVKVSLFDRVEKSPQGFSLAVLVKFELFKASSPKAIWEANFEGKSKPTNATKNVVILARTEAIVNGFNSQRLLIPSPATLPGQAIPPIADLKLYSNSNPGTIEFAKSESPVSASGLFTGVGGLPLAVVEHRWHDLKNQLDHPLTGNLHFTQQEETPVLVYRGVNGAAILRKLTAGSKDQEIKLAPNANAFEFRPGTAQFIYFLKDKLHIGELKDPEKSHPISVADNTNSVRIEFSRSGSLVAIWLAKDDLRVFKFDDLMKVDFLDDAPEVIKVAPQESIVSMCFSPDDRLLAAETFGGDKPDLMVDLETKEIRSLDGNFKKINYLSFGDSGSSIFGISKNSKRREVVVKYSLADQTSVETELSGLKSVRVSPDGNRIALVNSLDAKLTGGDPNDQIAGLQVTSKQGVRQTPVVARWSHDGRFLAVSSSQGDVCVWKIKN